MRRMGVGGTLLALIAAFSAVSAKVAGTSLQGLVAGSDVVVLAKVMRVERIEGVAIAVLSVEMTFKGPDAEAWAVAATPTWTCDISGVVVGERGLFFLEPYRSRPATSRYKPGPHLLDQVAARGLGLLHSITHSGRGRMPVWTVDGVERLTVYQWEVLLPTDIEAEAVEVPDAHCSGAFDKTVSMERTLDWVRQYVMDDSAR
ncbi:MAG TPA: hypothetical protein VFO11_12590 [Candidatus Polarisedimenticolaceae bacterium]|nr:hypothetical protein [Candidatus Polarisedimenticolaceae bacterium]